jgi:hypothetical protein
VLTQKGLFDPFAPADDLIGPGEVFVATGNLALESRAPKLDPNNVDQSAQRVSFFARNASSSSASSFEGARVDGVTFIGGFWDNIGLFGSFNANAGQTAAQQGFFNPAVNAFAQDAAFGNPNNPLQLSPSALAIINSIAGFVVNPNNTANGCVILAPQSCQPIGRIWLALEVDDGQLLDFKFFDDEEEQDDPFTNRGDEEEWQ